MEKSLEKGKDVGELKVLKYGEKILSVYRRCSCGGSVIIKTDTNIGHNIATCEICGASFEWVSNKK